MIAIEKYHEYLKSVWSLCDLCKLSFLLEIAKRTIKNGFVSYCEQYRQNANLTTNWAFCSRTVKTKIHNFAKLPSRKLQHLWTQKLTVWLKKLKKLPQSNKTESDCFHKGECSKESYQILEIVQNKSPSLRRPLIYIFLGRGGQEG